MYQTDQRIVITLDAGGTNFVFGAMRGNRFIIEPITKPSNSHDLDLCIHTLISGFEEVIASLEQLPVAISFAFPGPADYANGIIGGYLPNFPSFRDGVALGEILRRRFGIPVYINNDGDLFALGEAMEGLLPEVNARIAAMGGEKKYTNPQPWQQLVCGDILPSRHLRPRHHNRGERGHTRHPTSLRRAYRQSRPYTHAQRYMRDRRRHA